MIGPSVRTDGRPIPKHACSCPLWAASATPPVLNIIAAPHPALCAPLRPPQPVLYVLAMPHPTLCAYSLDPCSVAFYAPPSSTLPTRSVPPVTTTIELHASNLHTP